jgi:succinoglycan biosynthesis transport protein ExoP
MPITLDLVPRNPDQKQLPVPTVATQRQAAWSAEPRIGGLRNFRLLISRNRRTVAAFATAGLAIGLGAALSSPHVYRAHLTLELLAPNDSITKLNLPGIANSTPTTDTLTEIRTQTNILESEALIDRALKRLQIASPAALHAPESATVWGRVVKNPDPNDRDGLIELAGNNLSARAVAQTRIVEIDYDSTDPTAAARFANALAAEFIDRDLEANRENSRKITQQLLQQLEDLRGTLQQSEDALANYARRRGMVSTGEKQDISDDKLRRLQAELAQAQADRVAKQSRFEIVQNAGSPDALPDVLNDPSLQAMQTSLVDLRRQQAELAASPKPDYSRSQKLRADIEALEAAIDEQRVKIMIRMSDEFQAAQRREELLAATYRREARLATEDSEKAVEYESLKRDVETNRETYAAMLQRVREYSAASAIKVSSARVIDPARPPRLPYKPNMPLDTGAGLAGGLLLGIVVSVARAREGPILREPGEAELLLGVPELGVIPNARPAKRADAARRAGGTTSVVADSFRMVLASLMSPRGQDQTGTLVIASPGPAEGKTTIATNLAIALAGIGRKVLLVDGDIRNPQIHKVFDGANSRGLTNLLKDPVPDPATMNASVRNTDIPNLSLLTSGPPMDTATDLALARYMPHLLAHYRQRFDMLVIDTAPMLSIADARILGRISDGIVLVVRAGRSTCSATQYAFRRLVEDRTRVLGVVLNDWNVNASEYRHYSQQVLRLPGDSVDTSRS